MERDKFNITVSGLNKISTHTLTWSVTSAVINNGIITYNFNSHAHVERDHMNGFNVNMSKISTHTLTWSVTLHVCKFLHALQFQLTRSRGA